jgi:dTDP-4-amino-4,6-dideoxygalactose transaminase
VVGDLANTERIVSNTFWIGVYPGLTGAMLDYVVGHFEQFIEARAASSLRVLR